MNDMEIDYKIDYEKLEQAIAGDNSALAKAFNWDETPQGIVTGGVSTEPSNRTRPLMNDAWREYAADFNALTDAEVEAERRSAQNLIDENESWTEAVASWIAAGRPRSNTKQSEGDT